MKKLWKKAVVGVALTLTLLMLFVACGQEESEIERWTPSEVVDQVLGEFQEQDPATLIAEESEDGQDFLDDALSVISGKLTAFDYEIGSERIDGDEATVEVAVTTIGFGKIYTAAMDEALYDIAEQVVQEGESAGESREQELSELEEATATDDTESVYRKIFSEKFVEKLSAAKKDYKKTVKLRLVKSESGEWGLGNLDADGEFVSALFGDLFKSASDYNIKVKDKEFLNEIFGESEESQ